MSARTKPRKSKGKARAVSESSFTKGHRRHPMRIWASPGITAYQRAAVEAAGGDPSTVLEVPFSLLTSDVVMSRTGLSRKRLEVLVKQGKFPQPLPYDKQVIDRLPQVAS